MKSQMDSVHPELKPYLTWMLRAISRISFKAWAIPVVRKFIAASTPKKWMDSPTVHACTIPRGDGQGSIPAFVVNGQRKLGTKKSLPAVLFIHGGGYIAGTAAMAVPSAQRMAQRLNCVVVIPDYRLAPESRHNESLEDNYGALQWMHDNANEMGINREKIAVYGESAGGGHAAALSIAARDRGKYKICAQVLIYPMLDDRTGSSRAVHWPTGQYIWTAPMNRVGWTSHLGVEAGSEHVPASAVPSRVTSLKGLPPTFIGVGSIDLFHEEDVEFANRLREANVPVQLELVLGAYHGFDMLAPDAECTKKFVESWSQMLAHELHD